MKSDSDGSLGQHISYSINFFLLLQRKLELGLGSHLRAVIEESTNYSLTIFSH